MPTACARTSSGDYPFKHNPAAYYTNVACEAQDLPLAEPPDVSARFTFITPNMCNDAHDCPVDTGDKWLSQLVPTLLTEPECRAGTMAIFITWDEDDRNEDNQIATFVVSPSTPVATVSTTRFDHYSMLHTTQELFGLPTDARGRRHGAEHES